MSLALYMDMHVRHAITRGIRQRGIDVLTAQEDGGDELDDGELLQRATALNRVIFSYDRDFSKLTARLLADGVPFSGVIAVRRQRLQLSRCLDDLELMCKVHEPEEMRNRLEFIPIP